MVLSGCRSVKPTQPDLPPSTINVEPLPPSNIDVPISVDLASTFSDLEREVPREVYSPNWPNTHGDGNCRVEYKWFFRRDPLAISLSGQNINVSSTGYYGAAADVRLCCGWLCPWVGASCGTKNLKQLKPSLLKYGFTQSQLDTLDNMLTPTDSIVMTSFEKFNKDILKSTGKLTTSGKQTGWELDTKEAPRQIRIGISSAVSLANNYQLKTKTTLSRFDPVNRCLITFLNIDITNKILERATPQINNALNKFDNSMAQYNFRSNVEPVWNNLFEAIPVGDIGFITINPEQVRLSSLNGSGSKVDFSIGLTVKPVFSMTKPDATTPIPLPDITTSSPGNAFNLFVDGKLQYAPLSTILNNELVKLGNIPIDDGGYVSLSNARAFGIGNAKLLLQVYFKGKVKGIRYKGWLYLTGTPTYNPVTGELSFPDLDYSIETRNILLRVANWLLGSKVKETIKEKAKLNIASNLDAIKQKLQTSMNRDVNENISTEGSVDNLNVVGLLPLNDYILVRTNATGKLKVIIKK